jgi:hypothetical protein
VLLVGVMVVSYTPLSYDVPMSCKICALLIVSLLAFLPSASAQEKPAGFRSPSGNIFCQADKADTGYVLRCDVMKISNKPPPRPKDCDLDWGRAFEIADNAEKAARLCYGDTVANEALPLLAYGAAWQRHGFSCKSEQSGVRCVNGKGRGLSWRAARSGCFSLRSANTTPR